MKKKLTLLVLIMALSLSLMGCGAKEQIDQVVDTDELGELIDFVGDVKEKVDENPDLIEDLKTMADENPEDIASTVMGAVAGLETNETGEIRIVTLTDEELREAVDYESVEVTMDQEENGAFDYKYTSSAESEEIIAYFKELLLNTENYSIIEPLGDVGAMFTGTINDRQTFITINNEDKPMPVVEVNIILP